MWGISILDILESFLKFEGFRHASVWEKIKWILLYPFGVIMLVYVLVVWKLSEIKYKMKRGR